MGDIVQDAVEETNCTGVDKTDRNIGISVKFLANKLHS